jgi:S1-C subfamily serine protease
MPVWGWITLAVIGAAGFVGGGLVYMSRGNEAAAMVKQIDDGGDAEATKQKLLDQIKGLEDDITVLKGELTAAKKAVGSTPKENGPLGEIESKIIPGVVKVIPYVGDQPQQNTATGFLIDVGGTTLVATTYRVCEGAGKVALKLPTGTEYDMEGIVAAAERQDIAILKPKSAMPGIKTLTLAENPSLHRGDTVYAIGNPGKQEFTTSRGVITRVLSQDKYLEEEPQFDVAMRRDAAANAQFIEHDARIFPGDYGGPLLNENLEVIGMNQVLVTMRMNDRRTIVQTFGAAEEIKFVKAVAAKATDTIIPYPAAPKKEEKEEKKEDEKKEDEAKEPPMDDDVKPEDDAKPEDGKPEDAKPEDGDETPAADGLAAKIDALYTECEAFDWKPTSNEQYGKLCDVARRVTEAKLLDDDDAQKEAANEAADKVLKRLDEAKWESTEVEEVNKLATALEPAQDAGICFVGVVRGVTTVNGSPAITFQIEGTDTLAVVASEQASEMELNSRGIVLGQFAAAIKQKIEDKGSGKKFTAVLVRSKVLVKLE